MTVAELREALSKYPGDLPIFAGNDRIKGVTKQDLHLTLDLDEYQYPPEIEL